MGMMKRVYEEQMQEDIRGECEDCGAVCEVVEMGRRWCEKCWQGFQAEFDTIRMEVNLHKCHYCGHGIGSEYALGQYWCKDCLRSFSTER